MPDTTGDKVLVSVEDLNEVRTSLESSMDTKISKMESQLETLTALIHGLMNKDKPSVEVSKDADLLSDAAQRTAAGDGSTDKEHNKKWWSYHTYN